MTLVQWTIRVSEEVKERCAREGRMRGMGASAYARFLLEGGTFLEDEAQVREIVEDIERRLSRLEEMAHG
jgi:hypothetical protein